MKIRNFNSQQNSAISNSKISMFRIAAGLTVGHATASSIVHFDGPVRHRNLIAFDPNSERNSTSAGVVSDVEDFLYTNEYVFLYVYRLIKPYDARKQSEPTQSQCVVNPDGSVEPCGSAPVHPGRPSDSDQYAMHVHTEFVKACQSMRYTKFVCAQIDGEKNEELVQKMFNVGPEQIPATIVLNYGKSMLVPTEAAKALAGPQNGFVTRKGLISYVKNTAGVSAHYVDKMHSGEELVDETQSNVVTITCLCPEKRMSDVFRMAVQRLQVTRKFVGQISMKLAPKGFKPNVKFLSVTVAAIVKEMDRTPGSIVTTVNGEFFGEYKICQDETELIVGDAIVDVGSNAITVVSNLAKKATEDAKIARQMQEQSERMLDGKKSMKMRTAVKRGEEPGEGKIPKRKTQVPLPDGWSHEKDNTTFDLQAVETLETDAPEVSLNTAVPNLIKS